MGRGIVRGDSFPIERIFTRMPNGITLDEAYLTLKEETADADPGIFQKHITTTNQAGIGHVTDDGATGTARVRFDIAEADTLSMTADVDYYFDIQLVFSNAEKRTVEKGLTSATEQVTES